MRIERLATSSYRIILGISGLLGLGPEITKIDAPIDYVPLRSEHLSQVHELLQITFWPGIDGELAFESDHTVVPNHRTSLSSGC